MEPQARAFLEAIGSNSPVAVESSGRIGQSASETETPFLEELFAPLEAPDSSQAERESASVTARTDVTGCASKVRKEKVFMMDKIERLDERQKTKDDRIVRKQ